MLYTGPFPLLAARRRAPGAHPVELCHPDPTRSSRVLREADLVTADAASTSPTPPVELGAVRPRSNWRVRAAHGLYRVATRLHWAEPELLGLGSLVRHGEPRNHRGLY